MRDLPSVLEPREGNKTQSSGARGNQQGRGNESTNTAIPDEMQQEKQSQRKYKNNHKDQGINDKYNNLLTKQINSKQ